MASKLHTVSKTEEENRVAKFDEMLRSLVFAVILAVVFRSFFFEPFHIPSGSMRATLLEGDYIFVSKFSYGYSRYSFPLSLPLFSGRIFDKHPNRGDVIVFRKPHNESVNYIKRLIGLPGDRIQVIGGEVFINSKKLERERIEDFISTENDGTVSKVVQYRETLPNGISYNVLDHDIDGAADNTAVYVVPEGNYFFMGDNRDNSVDSRFLDDVGYVPEQNLVGRAEIIFFSSTAPLIKVWQWAKSFRTERFFKDIQLAT